MKFVPFSRLFRAEFHSTAHLHHGVEPANGDKHLLVEIGLVALVEKLVAEVE